MARRVHTMEFWLQQHKLQEESGLSQRAYCQQNGLSYAAFTSAKGKARRLHLNAPSLALVEGNGKTNGHDAEELKQLRADNLRLRILVSDYALDIQALKEYAGRN